MSFAHAMGGIREEGKLRSENDYYPTPPFATYALLEHSAERSMNVPKSVLEPAGGRGWMAYELARSGRNVFATDLIQYEDLVYPVSGGFDFLTRYKATDKFKDVGIVTNPPYGNNLAQKFVEHSLDIGCKYVAVLVRTMFSESGVRYPFFTQRPPTEIMYFSQRFSCSEELFFTKPLSGMVAFSWWVWDHRLSINTNTFCSWINTRDMYTSWMNDIGPDEYERIKKFVMKEEDNGLAGLINT